MTTLEQLTLTTPNAQQAVLEALIEQAEQEFCAICARDDVPEEAQSVIVRMVQHLYSQVGSAGLSGESFSGASESYMSDYADNLKRAMYRFRKLVTV